ncbi:hypothetical protein EU245_10670 [Lentibacillus lipolyticus]|nr:hypothetical protein EU245_10670 [Lentibacillus lipolyticus]
MEQTMVVGLIPAPELPADIAVQLAEELSQAFSDYIMDAGDWSIRLYHDPLTGAAENIDQNMRRAAAIKKKEGWDYTVCLTDLPMFSHKDVVLGDVNEDTGVAQVSIPAFGFFPLRKRVKKAIIQMVSELYYKVNGYPESADEGAAASNEGHLLKRRFYFSPIRKTTHPTEREKSDVLFVLRPRFYGRTRLLLGMAYANKPWSIVPAFKSVVAVAFATGAYGLIFPTLWKLSVAYGSIRFVALMLAAIFGMVIWVIFAHNLWEKPSYKSERKLRILYNAATVMTLGVAVMVQYGVLYILFLTAVAFFVPPDLYASVTGLEGKVGFRHYMQLAWLVTSVATVAGAIGSSLEDDSMVRNITYGYRQQQRYKRMEYYGDDIGD